MSEEKKEDEINIPEQIKNFNFVRIGEDENGDRKLPIEKGWPKKIHNLEWLKSNVAIGIDNYGVQSNNSFILIDGESRFLIIVDFDSKDLQDKIINQFPETFTTTSGSPKQCVHIWLASDNNKSFKILDENKNTLADIQGEGKQVIGPGSKHKCGSTYSVVKDIPIAFIHYAEIEAILRPYDKSPKKPEKPLKQYTPKGTSSDISSKIMDSVSMEDVLKEVGVDISKNPTNCPFHSSVGGKCLGFDNETAHCFHCDGSWNKYSILRQAKNLTDKNTFEWFANKAGMLDELIKQRKEFNVVKIPNEEIEEINKDMEGKKEIKKTYQVGDFILNESDMAQRLDHAVGSIKIGEDVFRYYGVKINQRVQKIIGKGRNAILIEMNERVDALVLENGLIISVNKKPKGLCYEFDSILSLNKNRWTLGSIEKFTSNNYKEDDYNFKKVFDKFKSFYKGSMVFDNPNWYDLNAIWDIATYFWDITDKFLIPKHEGISGSAKSKGMKISSNLSFNGIKFVCPTPATFFRYRHNNKAMICIEEAERLFDDSKKHNSDDSLLVEYLNAGYEKGNSVPRQNDKDISKTDEFDPSGFTRIGAIKQLKGALEKRSITLSMIKAPKKDDRGNVEIPASNEKEYQKARDMMYICGLKFYKEYVKALGEIENVYDLVNRQWVISKPLIAIARCIDKASILNKSYDDLNKSSDISGKLDKSYGIDDNFDTNPDTSDTWTDNSRGIEKQIGFFLKKLFAERDNIPDETSWNRVLGKCLIELTCGKGNETIFISNETLCNLFKAKNSSYNIFNSSLSVKGMNTHLKNMGFGNYSGHNTKRDERGYNLSLVNVCEILIRQEFFQYEEIIDILQDRANNVSEVSEVSDTSFIEDKFKKQLPDTSRTLPRTDDKNNINDDIQPKETQTTFSLVKPVKPIIKKKRDIPSDLILENHIPGTPIPLENRGVQFWESKECADIVCEHTEKEVYEFLKLNDGISIKEAYNKMGIGFFKHLGSLLKENKVKRGEDECIFIQPQDS